MSKQSVDIQGVGHPAELAPWADYIAEQLKRKPRGLRAIAAWTDSGLPAVIRVASVVAGKPFPTLFWLLDPALCLRIDRLEAAGAIAQLQAEVDQSPALRSSMAEDHHRYKARRETFLQPEEREYLLGRGMMSALTERGIGGIADNDRIRCLHTWYAAHLVEPNTIGRMTDALLSDSSEF